MIFKQQTSLTMAKSITVQRHIVLLTLLIGFAADISYINNALLSLIYEELSEKKSFHLMMMVEMFIGVLMSFTYLMFNNVVFPSALRGGNDDEDNRIMYPRPANEYQRVYGGTTPAMIV